MYNRDLLSRVNKCRIIYIMYNKYVLYSDMNTVDIEQIGKEFSIRQDIICEMLIKWSNVNNNKIIHRFSDGRVCVQESFYLQIIKSKEYIDSFICDYAFIEDHIVEDLMSLRQSYIYFLLDVGRVVYVGQTNNIYNRAATHRKDKLFDDVAVCQVHSTLLNIAEHVNIIHHSPRLNKTMWSPKAMFKRVLEYMV